MACQPYTDCDNKGEGWMSLFKRLIVVQDDGTLAVRACCEEATGEDGDCEEYVTCERKHNGWADLFKRTLIIKTDGGLAIRTCCRT